MVCEESWPDPEFTHSDADDSDELFFDDASGAVLPPELIRKGREDEFNNTDDLKVWELKFDSLGRHQQRG